MGFLAYYLLIFVAFYLLRHPALLALVVVVYLLRRFIPDPVVWARTAGTMRKLRAQVEANPANATARRDLARLYLERWRPRRALELLEQARRRLPDDPELLYLTGMALYRAGRYEEALGCLVQAVDADPRVGFGDPYRVAGDALAQLGRLEEAEDAYERLVDTNTSSVEGLYKLARIRRKRGDREGAREVLRELRRTYGQLPRYARRKSLTWRLRGGLASLLT